MKRISIFLCALALTGIACNQEGVGGKADIAGTVLYNNDPVPNAIVYIAYGASSWPGFDPELYDNQITASSTDATFFFPTLYKGDYYIWAKGIDPASNEDVSGGVDVKIKSKKESIVKNITVIK